MELKQLMQEAFCNVSDQSELAGIAYDLVRGELSREQAAIKILEYVEGMGQRLPCIISESVKASQ